MSTASCRLISADPMIMSRKGSVISILLRGCLVCLSLMVFNQCPRK